MRRRIILAAGLAAGGAQITPVITPARAQADRENTLFLDLKDGRVVIEMRPDLAPRHVERIKALARQGFYDNTPFHRVIDGFMAQGGDPTGTGTGGSRLPDLADEFTPATRARFLRGTCGMAKTAAPNTANSQFFVCFAPAPFLDGNYTIWGRVISGMERVDNIKKGPGRDGTVQGPDRIARLRVAADVPA